MDTERLETIKSLLTTAIRKCDKCGSINDCRKVGANEGWICFFCALENPQGVADALNAATMGFMKPVTAEQVRETMQKHAIKSMKGGVN